MEIKMNRKYTLIVIALMLWLTFPVHGEPLPKPTMRPVLTIMGKITHTTDGKKALFDKKMLKALPQKKIRTSTPWFDQPVEFSGPTASALMEKVGAYGKTLLATALNDYSIRIPLDDFKKYDVIFATEINGKTLSVREKGPIFVIYPFDDIPEIKNETYFLRCIWQLKSLVVE